MDDVYAVRLNEKKLEFSERVIPVNVAAFGNTIIGIFQIHELAILLIGSPGRK